MLKVGRPILYLIFTIYFIPTVHFNFMLQIHKFTLANLIKKIQVKIYIFINEIIKIVDLGIITQALSFFNHFI